MFGALRSFSERNLFLFLGLSLAAGLLFPEPGGAPDFVPPAILAVMMGFSYSKVRLEDLKEIRLREVLLFYAARFILYPFALYGLCLAFLPDFRYAVLLLALLPSAVSAAAMASIMGGNAALALAGTVLSSAVAPFLIPLVFGFFGSEIHVDVTGMFVTLAAVIFIPAIVYFGGIRHFSMLRDGAQRNAGFVSVLLFSVFIVIVVARLRDEILGNLPAAGAAFTVLSVFYGSFYILPWLWARGRDQKTRIGYTFVSGCNNMGLGVSLALLYFPGREMLYIIVCEFLWVFLLCGFQYFLKVRSRQYA